MDFTPSVVCINGGLDRDTVRTHDGMCHVGLYQTYAGESARGDWLLREVISLWSGTEQFDDEIALVQPLFTRLAINGLFVPVTAEEGAALQTLCRDADDYYAVNDYATDYSNEEDRLLGIANVAGLAVCFNQTNIKLRKSLPVGLREKPYRFRYRYVREKEYL